MKASTALVGLLVAIVSSTAFAQGKEDAKLRPQHHHSAREAGKPRLVGFTKAATTGDVGIFEINAMCQAEFGQRSRMCTLPEVQQTLVVPDLPATTAWVNTLTFLDPSEDCGGWGDGINGTVLDDLGRPSGSRCSEPHAVACCAPR